MLGYLFYINSFIIIVSVLFVIFSKNPIHSILGLMLIFFSFAGLYILLNAQFLAAVQVIVYSGAIMVLILYVIMMLNLNKDNEPLRSNKMTFMIFIFGGIFYLGFLCSLQGFQMVNISSNPDSQMGLTKNLGKLLFNKYVLPFELTGILFIASLVGAIVIAKRHSKEEK